jgi:plasmid stabilization system protein ParE
MSSSAQIDAVRPVLNELDAGVTAAEKVIDAVEANADKAAQVAEAGLEKVADVVPEALDKSVNVTAEVARRGVQIFRDPRKVVIILGIGGMVAGAGVGYMAYRMLKKKLRMDLEKEFEERLETEIDSMRDFYQRRFREGKYATPASAAEALGVDTEEEGEAVEEAVDALEHYQGKGVVAQPATKPQPVAYDQVAVAEDTVLQGISITQDGVGAEIQVQEKDLTVRRNVFVEGRPLVDDNWDAEAEEANRDPERPYVISHDEFLENAFEHEQAALIYYEGDDILAESNDAVIDEVESVVGNDNLSRFGHGSRDPNVVYIRNERTESDYEVTRSAGKYVDEVHPGLRHSDDYSMSRRRPRRSELE